MDDFNVRFEKKWKSIPTKIRPTNAQALVYYRKSFHPNINMLIIMYRETFLEVYQIEKTPKHTLLSSTKLQLKFIMPLFPNLPPKKAPLQILHLGVLALPSPPPKPFVQNQLYALTSLPSTSTNNGFGS